MKHYYAILFFLLLGITAHGQSNYTYLQTESVQWWGGNQQSSIDTLIIDVKPKGLYAEVSITMNYSTRGLSYNDEDSLEIQMMFQLPPEVEVTDMILWVFGQPEKAGVYDRWTASQIYEDIVDRRTDPAILHHYTWYDYYNSSTVSNLFKFNIFPVLNDLPRKARITYQIPLRANGLGNFKVPLPMNIAGLSDLPIEVLKLRYHPGAEFETGKLIELPTQPFTNNGIYLEADLTGHDQESINLSFETERSSIYLGIFDTQSSGSDYFQFSMIPRDVFDLEVISKKTIVLFDHLEDPDCGDISPSTTVNEFLGFFLPHYTEVDSINILFSGIINQWVSDDWMMTDSLTKDWIVDNISDSNIVDQSNLTNLILDAIQFIGENGNEGEILLVTNSNLYSDLNSSTEFIQTISGVLGDIKLHVIDLDNYSTFDERFYVGNQPYFGNEYALHSVSANSGGRYLSVQEMQYSDILDFFGSELTPSLEAVDIHLNRENGFTHSTFDVGDLFPALHIDRPIGIVGKLEGSGNFNLSCSAIETNGTLHQLNIPLTQVYSLDTVTDNIWGGLKQRDMYDLNEPNWLIQSIVQNSKDYRVLSKYTAFLALEPSEGPLPVTNDDPFGGPTGINEESTSDIMDNSFSIFPNPFNNTLTIDAQIIGQIEVRIELIDLLGNEVLSIYSGTFEKGSSMHSFDLADVENGIYFIRITSKTGQPITTLRAVKI